jgi:hypothetical protein
VPSGSRSETKTVTPPPAAALLSLGKLKPLSVKAGKWTKVKLKVTNTGGTAAGPLQVKAKAPKGVIVKTGTTKVPAASGRIAACRPPPPPRSS